MNNGLTFRAVATNSSKSTGNSASPILSKPSGHESVDIGISRLTTPFLGQSSTAGKITGGTFDPEKYNNGDNYKRSHSSGSKCDFYFIRGHFLGCRAGSVHALWNGFLRALFRWRARGNPGPGRAGAIIVTSADTSERPQVRWMCSVSLAKSSTTNDVA